MLMDFLSYKKAYIKSIGDANLQDVLSHSIYISIRLWGEFILSSDKMRRKEKYRGIVGFYSDVTFNKLAVKNRTERISIGLYFLHILSDVLLYVVLIIMIGFKSIIR